MAGKMTVDYDILEGVIDHIEELRKSTGKIAAVALYKGAGVQAEQIKQYLRTVPTEPSRAVPRARNSTGPLNSATVEEIEAIGSHVGIAKYKDGGGEISTAIGFNGYMDTITTKKWPKGFPIAMIVRSIESGSSVRNKHPFFRKAVKKGGPVATEAMAEAATEEINKILKGGK